MTDGIGEAASRKSESFRIQRKHNFVKTNYNQVPKKTGSQDTMIRSASKSRSVAANRSEMAHPFKMSIKKNYMTSSSSIGESESDQFFHQELVWPSSSASGMTPAMLAAPLARRSTPVGTDDTVVEEKPQTKCEKMLFPKPPPRPEKLPWNIFTVLSDPPSVEIDDVEEFLVHDNLFVEYFNSFLSLPAFPEPICFNMDTGGFEVVSDGRQKLAAQIKEAVRSQNLTPKMYRLAKNHAFATIPLIPIEDTDGPAGVEIDTSFQVTTLNKDQGIYWIKAERLPLFLESDFYFQYRLARVISQAKLFNEKKEFVIMKIDFTPRQKKVKKSEEVPPPNLEEIIVKKMYVSFGDVKGAAKEAWFTQAKDELSVAPSFTTLSPKVSSHVVKDVTMTTGSTPGIMASTKSSDEQEPKSSVFKSAYFGVYSPGIIGPGSTECPFSDDNLLRERMFSRDRPFTPRPSDVMHVATDKVWMKGDGDSHGLERLVKPGKIVFMQPKMDSNITDSDSGTGEMDSRDEELERRMNMQPIIDSLYRDGSWEPNSNVEVELPSVDELAALAVAATMRKALADQLSVSESTVLKDPVIRDLYPSENLNCVDVKNLDRFYARYFLPDDKTGAATAPAPGSDIAPDSGTDSKVPTPKLEKSRRKGKTAGDKPKEPKSIKWNRPLKESAEEESDHDSLLDSDDDFEERDIRFRRKQDKWYNLTSMKGIGNFKTFLEGTPGERYWELWIDIDKGRLLQDEDEEKHYSMYMRERYYKQGSPFELSVEDKSKLGLESTGRWCPEYLFQIQGKVLEPLLLYWAPRYLLKNLLQSDPEKYQSYRQMKAALPQKESDPFPMTKTLLPLRPKSCCPRTRQGPGFEEMNYPRSQMDRFKANEAELVTSPMVGNRRVFGADTLQRLAMTPTARFMGLTPPPKKIEDTSEFERRCQTRPTTASSTRSVSRLDDGGGSVKISNSKKSVKMARSDSRTSAPLKGGRVDKKESFVGKLPGIGGKEGERQTKSAVVGGRRSDLKESPDDGTKERCRCKSAVSMKGTKKMSLQDAVARQSSLSIKEPSSMSAPCVETSLKRMMGEQVPDRTESGEILGPVKKPRDLLSPMLRIVDTKGQRSRVTSAVTPRCTSVNSENTTFFRQDSIESSKACDSRPSSSGNARDTPQNMTDCDFMGSERMEILLQALHHDMEAGKAFRKYMDRTDTNEVALNCIEFWARVQDYRKLFYKDKLDLFNITKTAKMIFAQFVVGGATKSIEVSDSIEFRIMQCLKPAYEDLFDEAEEHALKVLFGAFLDFLKSDVKTYCKVERTDVTRRLETKNTYILNLEKKGLIKERPQTPDDPMEGYHDPVYDEDLIANMPEEFKEWTFDKLVHNRIELEHFRQHLADNYVEIDFKCWMDMEAWRRTAPNDTRKRDQRARDIKKQYLNKKYFFGPNSPAGKEGQNKVMEIAGGWGKFLEDKPSPEMILEAQKYVKERLEKKHLPAFLATKAFQDRQMPKMSESDLSDDVVVQKKRRTQAVLKGRRLSDSESSEEEIVIIPAAAKAVQRVRSKGELLFSQALERVKGKLLKPTDADDTLSNKDKSFLSLTTASKTNLQSVTPLPPIKASPSDEGSGSSVVTPATSVSSKPAPKLLESKWISSTKEIFLFKQALKNPVTCQQFQKYVSIKGDNLENDLLFWLEVQRYKQMHHAHTEDSMLAQKINAIINCFLDSPIPPSLQIDIPQEMAEKILDHKHEKGPYLFREAQLATFRILLSHWTPFCEFRNNLGAGEKALSTLERHRLLARKREREYNEELERQKRERQSRAEEDIVDEFEDLPDELRDDEEDNKAKISFSYADYLNREAEHAYEEDGTQTIRSMLEKSADGTSKRGGSEKSKKNTVKADTSVGADTEELFQRHFRRPSQTSDNKTRRPSQLSAQVNQTKGSSKQATSKGRKASKQ